MFGQQLRDYFRQLIANLSRLPSLPEIDDRFLLEGILSDQDQDNIKPLVYRIDVEILLLDRYDSPREDRNADHPNRMDEAYAADPREHGDDDHDVEVAVGLAARRGGFHHVVSLHCEGVGEDQEEDLADKGVPVEVARRPEDKTKEDEPDRSCHYLSGLGTVENVDGQISDIESDEDEGEKFVPEGSALLQV